ncbi:hypothetical protein BDQ17DRAFT_1425382 [Cyathus striatus]|nr:hypothetical protein BDQ17DRAFT_1425382 [Cyathus striatus]
MVESEWEALHIKAETFEPQYSLLSPPASPFLSSVVESSLSSASRRAPSSVLAGTKRLHPYPSVTPKRGATFSRDSVVMSNDPAFGTWLHTGSRGSVRALPAVERRSVEGDENNTNLGHQFINDPYVVSMADLRPISSSSNHTSSLTGAVGDPSVTGLRTRATVGVGSAPPYPNVTPGLWNPAADMTIAMQTANYPGVAGHGFSASSDMCNSTSMSYGTPSRTSSSPDSLPPSSPAYPQAMFNDPYSVHDRNIRNVGSYPSSAPYQQGHGVPVPSNERADAEIRHLRRRVQELEHECRQAREVIDNMGSTAHSGSLPPTPPRSASFQESWRNRTEVRKRIYCSLNRAGNALCAWHDSRRERRMYPPRNAPPGYLNCGCTFDEALFEESLARHGVGSYHPGETVRMDPALRNPLLKLLQQRYGYKDGDFELDPNTLQWQDGESPTEWEQRAHSGSVTRRRQDTDRH